MGLYKDLLRQMVNHVSLDDHHGQETSEMMVCFSSLIYYTFRACSIMINNVLHDDNIYKMIYNKKYFSVP